MNNTCEYSSRDGLVPLLAGLEQGIKFLTPPPGLEPGTILINSQIALPTELKRICKGHGCIPDDRKGASG